MLLAQINRDSQGIAEFQNAGGDSQQVTLCLAEAVSGEFIHAFPFIGGDSAKFPAKQKVTYTCCYTSRASLFPPCVICVQKMVIKWTWTL